MFGKKILTHKRIASLFAFVMAGVMVSGGTYAWNDYRQHKTNEANADGIIYKARLVEKYDPNDTKDWNVKDPAVTKELSILNPGAEGSLDSDDNYGDIFVRLQLKEFMEFYPINYKLTDERYMIDESGAFIAFDLTDQQGALDFAADLDAKYGNGSRIPVKMKMYGDDVERWYIPTKESDPNGIYGDFIVTGVDVLYNAPQNIIEDIAKVPVRASSDQKDKHNDYINTSVNVDLGSAHDNGECLYTPHTWGTGLYGFEVNGAGKVSFGDYIEWIFGDDVITYDQWVNVYNSQPVEKWVVDTNSEEGWVYWISPLAPKQQTTNLLEKIALIKQPDDAFYYALHADMQAVCFKELDNWLDASKGNGNLAPQDVIDALKNSYSKATSVIVTPDVANVSAGSDTTFTATVRGTSGISQSVVWTVTGNVEAGTTIDNDGKLIVDANEVVGTVLEVIATTADGAVSGKGYVTVQ